MHFILIIMFSSISLGNGSNGIAVAMQEFNTQEACIAASSLARMPGATSANAVCVPKGLDK
jgi:hypothetical protein